MFRTEHLEISHLERWVHDSHAMTHSHRAGSNRELSLIAAQRSALLQALAARKDDERKANKAPRS